MDELADKSAQTAVETGVLKPEKADKFKDDATRALWKGIVYAGRQMIQDKNAHWIMV